MNSIGKILKNARIKKKLSLSSLSDKTKIKRDFLDAIEKEEWEKLPEFPVVLGFVKSICATLNLDPSIHAAILKRDYPPKELRINPKPDVVKKFVWGPRTTFLIVVACALIGVASYLLIQYINFIRPPVIEVLSPVEGEIVERKEVVVSGKVDSDSVVRVNNQPVLVGDGGNFQTVVELVNGVNEIVVVARSRSGKESTSRISVNARLDD
jgi:transcriptional regulator with XRE-family HTH domain